MTCLAIVKTTNKQCTNPAKNNGLCGVHLRAKNIHTISTICSVANVSNTVAVSNISNTVSSSISSAIVNTPSSVTPNDNDNYNNKHDAIQKFAQEKMNEYGLKDWTFKWDNAKRRYGVCSAKKKTISISSGLASNNSIEQSKDTVLHEIAHALCPGQKHNDVWKTQCVKIGAKPQRCYSSDVKPVDSKYELYCNKCKKSTPKFKKIQKTYSCRFCCKKYNNGKFSDKYILKFREKV
jgi:predicted SprT family Zn-dependent metalloprotease